MIVGEPQILGQLKQACTQARDNGSIGTFLDVVLDARVQRGQARAV